jgi:hypothetical protein
MRAHEKSLVVAEVFADPLCDGVFLQTRFTKFVKRSVGLSYTAVAAVCAKQKGFSNSSSLSGT